MEQNKRRTARVLADKYLLINDPTGWFEELYKTAENKTDMIPWADLTANPNLIDFLSRQHIDGADKRALVIGCGLGDDAEYLSSKGFSVDSFDISKTAIQWCKKRFKNSKVNYFVNDLLNLSINNKYDFILESYTLQVLPSKLHTRCIKNISGLLNINGELLLIARGRDEKDEPGKMPWPLTKQELFMFEKYNIKIISFEDYIENEDPPVRRFRVLYKKIE